MKTSFNIHRLILLAGLFLCQLAYGQQNEEKFYPQCSPVSPEASGLIKEVKYPVGYNTGVPEIAVPLYEIKSRNITLPVILNYHAGGFKAKEVAQTTGLGWNLSTNFQIAREIRGFDDFRKSGDTYGGYYYNNYGITDGPWNDDLYTDLRRFEMANGMIDSQPDCFYYNIAGKSGCFYLSKTTANRVFLPSPYNGIIISCAATSTTDTNPSVKFKITDTDGTEYHFTLAEVAYNSDNPGAPHQSAWKCTSIVSADKTETITLPYETLKSLYTYQDEEYTELYEDLNGVRGNPWHTFGGLYYADQVKQYANDSYSAVFEKFAAFNLSVPRTINYSMGGDAGLILYTKDPIHEGAYQKTTFGREFRAFYDRGLIQSRYVISHIRTSNQTLEFTYDSNDCLRSIEVTNAQNRTARKFYFEQSVVGYYESPNRTSRTNYLDRIRIVDARENTTCYSFDYKSKYAFANHTKGGNYWGGVNSWTSDRNSQIGTTVPAFFVPTRYYLSNHYSAYIDNFEIHVGGQYTGPVMMHNFADSAYDLIGQLRKITYPTGGSTEFIFGGNYGSLADGSFNNMSLGGTRIQEIRHYDTDGSLQSKKVCMT